jgi:hypothetical protein
MQQNKLALRPVLATRNSSMILKRFSRVGLMSLTVKFIRGRKIQSGRRELGGFSRLRRHDPNGLLDGVSVLGLGRIRKG